MDVDPWRDLASQTLVEATKGYLLGSDAGLQSAVYQLDRVLTLVYRNYLKEKGIELPDGGRDFHALVDRVMEEKSMEFLFEPRYAALDENAPDRFKRFGESLKYSYRPMRNRVKEGLTPDKGDTRLFIRRSITHLRYFEVDVSEADRLLPFERPKP